MADNEEGACVGVWPAAHLDTPPARSILDLQRLRRTLDAAVFLGGIVGSSPAIQAIHELIIKAIDRSFPVLIYGETGTGKELVAQCIHFLGPRRDRPFVAVDCSSITKTLFESELFGYVRGAFTGALQDRNGLFQAANTGTIFLDEIGELPKELQAKLLRVIQEGEVRKVGSTVTLPVDARIVAATNRDLKQAVEKGEFRKDLYYRLNVFEINLPPLRNRRVDIPILVAAFLKKHNDSNRPITGVADDFWADVMRYEWPGNVRELENLVQRSVALGFGPILRVEDDCRLLRAAGAGIEQRSAEPLAVLEKRTILKAISETSGDKLAAARILGIGKTTLYRKLKEYGFNSSQTPIASEIS